MGKYWDNDEFNSLRLAFNDIDARLTAIESRLSPATTGAENEALGALLCGNLTLAEAVESVPNEQKEVRMATPEEARATESSNTLTFQDLADEVKRRGIDITPAQVRIAALESENAALRKDAAVGRAIRKAVDTGRNVEIMSFPEEVNYTIRVSEYKYGCSLGWYRAPTILSALAAAGLMEEEVNRG